MNDQHTLLQLVREHIARAELSAWLVGGSVRDRLLNVANQDLDIAVDGDVFELGRTLAAAVDGYSIVLDRIHPTARVVWFRDAGTEERWIVDLVQLRAPTISEDLQLRDFTINALAVPLGRVQWGTADVLDPTGGLHDLTAGIVRACGPASLRDDPLRMLRALRFGAQFGFALAPALQADLEIEHGRIMESAPERIRYELLRLLSFPHAAQWLRKMDEVGLLTTIIPELEPARDCDQPGGHHYLPVLSHMLEAVRVWEWIEALGLQPERAMVVDPPLAVIAHPALSLDLAFPEEITARMQATIDDVPRRALFKLALLMHDIAKPQTKAIKPDGSASFYDHQALGAELAWEIMRRLRISNSGCDYVQTVVREHMRPGQLAELGTHLSRRAIYRFFDATGDAGPDVLVHMLCDYMAMRGPHLDPQRWAATLIWVNHMLTQFYAAPETVRPTQLVNGHDVMTVIGLEPGPQVGRIMALLREAQASGEVTTREEALELARQLAP